MPQNPNWPLIDEAVSFANGPNSPAPFDHWCSVIGRTENQWTCRRGRDYELDQVQAATVATTLRNDDAAFDPDNTASPFYPQVTPWRGYRRRAQLPATVNLLTADQATAFYSTRGAVGTGAPFPQWTSGMATIQASTGGNPSNFYSSASPATYTFTGWSVAPGEAYTAQCLAFGAGGVTVQISLRFYDATGATLSTVAGGSTTSSTAPGALIAVTATAPAGAAGAAILVVGTGGSGSTGVYASCLQVEQAAAASAWVTPGTWFDMQTGFVERWPQDWTDGGTYGTSALTCVDAIAYLSQRRLRSPGYMELLALDPNWLYPLDEASGSAFYDLTAQSPVASSLYSSAASPTQLAAGAALAGTGIPLGIGGPTLDINNQGTSGVAVLALPTGIADVVNAAFTRVIAFRCTAQTWQNPAYIWRATDGAASANDIEIYGFGAGYLQISAHRAGSTTFSASSNAPINDGAWHLLVLTCSADGLTWTATLDGTSMGGATLSSDGRPAAAPRFEHVGGFIGGMSVSQALGGFLGQVSCVTHLPVDLHAAGSTLTDLWSTFRYGGPGLGSASSATRYADILRWAGWKGASAIDDLATGECRTYGPSVDLLASASQQGTDGMSALQTVVDTDDGEHWVDRSGVVTFHARGWRFNRTTPAVTFGDGAGEIPYTACSFGLDPTRLANDAAITQTATGVTTTRVDTASIDANGDVQLQRTVNDTALYSLQDMATYLAHHYAAPVQRIESLRVEPASFTVDGVPSTAAWQAVLSLELGDSVQVNRRPPGVPQVSFTGFVERIDWSMDDTGNAVCDLQVSPDYGKQFWALDSSSFSVLDSTTVCGY